MSRRSRILLTIAFALLMLGIAVQDRRPRCASTTPLGVMCFEVPGGACYILPSERTKFSGTQHALSCIPTD